MWERFTNWIRGLLGINREELSKITGSLATSSQMEDAQEAWRLAFINQPAWDKDRQFKTSKFPGLVTSYVASLCSAELTLSCGVGKRAEWIQDQLDRFVLYDIRNHIQKAAALSYIVLRPSSDGVNLYSDLFTPDTFIPIEIKGGKILSGVFIITQTVKNGAKETVYIRLETHQMQDGIVHISNRAYKADNVKANAEVPLSVVDDWADLPTDADAKVGRPLFAVLKMPFANQVDLTSALPVSLYVNAMDSFEKIDRLYNDFIWEMESGRRKQIFDITAVQWDERTPQTNLAHYKTTDQYIVLNMGGKGDPNKPYDDYTPEMRVEAYQSALNLQVRMLESQVGVSPGTFDFDVQGGVSRAKTATEVLADSIDTYNTIKAIQENGLRQGLVDLAYVYDIYATQYGLAPAGAISPTVEFGDSIFEDTGTEFLRRKALVDAGYEDPVNLLAWYYGEDVKQAAKRLPAQQTATGIFGNRQYMAGEDGV